MLNIAIPTGERNPAAQGPAVAGDAVIVADDLPAGFDPAAFPIISHHWFGVSPDAASVETVAQAV